MRKMYLFKTFLLLCALIVGAGSSWGTDYSYTFTSNAWSTNGAQTLGGISWTLDMSGGTISSYIDNQGMHFGTNSSSCNSVSISTSGIEGTISAVTVEASRGASLVGTLQVTVGGNNFKIGENNTTALTTDNASYSYTGSGSGIVNILWTKSSGKGAFYIKKITVTYTTSNYVASPTFSETAGAVESGTEVTVTAPEGCTLYYTTDGSDPVSSGMSAGGRTKAFTITEAQTIKAVSMDDHGFFSDVVSAAYTIAVLSDPTFTVADMTLETGEQKAPVVTTNSEGEVTFESGNTNIATIVNGKINAVAKGTVTITANIAKDTENLLKAARTTFEVTVTPGSVWESTSEGIDEITYSTFGFTGTASGYSAFTEKSVSSSAVYAGQVYKQNNLNWVQIRNQSPAGIVTTTSGGNARKIIVNWESGTGDGRYIEVYGKNSAYESGTDLYDKNKKGTLLGTIKKGTNTELIIEGNYEYIGIHASDPVFMTNITVYWEGESVSLSDDSDYTPVAADYAKVTVNRSFVEGWNGIVLPFNLTESVKTALGATAVKTLASATETAGAITLGFEDASLPVAAGTPVLVKLATAKESGDVIMNGVKLETTTPATITKTISETNFSLTGTYSSTTLTDAEAYFVSNGTFYHKAKGTALTAKPFRAYILQTGNAAARVLFDLDGETTGIKELDSLTNSQMDNCYDLSGRKIVNGQSVNGKLQRGLYIVNGKKYIVK